MGYRALPNVHPVTGRSCSRDMERGPAHSQEDAMSKLQTQSQKVQASQLLYRPSDRKTTSGEIIRSKKTAELLCLSRDERHESDQAFATGTNAARSGSARPLKTQHPFGVGWLLASQQAPRVSAA